MIKDRRAGFAGAGAVTVKLAGLVAVPAGVETVMRPAAAFGGWRRRREPR
jgi:hypothetical protein